MVTADADIESTLGDEASAAGGEASSDGRVDGQVNPDAAPGETVTPEQESRPAPETNPSADYSDLQARYDAWKSDSANSEPLTSEERTRLGRYQQSIEDSNRAREQARQQARQERARLEQTVSELPSKLLDAALKRFNIDSQDDPAVELLQRDLGDMLKPFLADAEAFGVMPWAAGVASRTAEFVKALGGDATSALRDLEGKSFGEVIGAYGEAAYELGKKTSPDAKKVADLQGKLDKANAEIERLTGERGAKGSGPSANGKEATPSKLTREAVSAMSMDQVAELWKTRPDEMNAL